MTPYRRGGASTVDALHRRPKTAQRAIVAVVTFPLHILAPAIAERAGTWAELEMAWQAFPIQRNHGKPVVRCVLESAAWLAQIMIWSSGEAELETIRLIDDWVVNKHYELSGRGDLDMLLDELVRLLVQREVPAAAVVFRAFGSSSQARDAEGCRPSQEEQ